MQEKIRIKDIAERAGVSQGTVDRVIHNRPNVSKKALDKVQKALKELNYQPNAFASALAHNRKYNFYCIMPKHSSEAYWGEIELGAINAAKLRQDFNIGLEFIYYNRLNSKSFIEAYTKCLNSNPNGVILVPTTLSETKKFTDELHKQSIPFILVDSYMPEIKPLSFYGQDSIQSGIFAAKILMLLANKEKSIMLMKQTIGGEILSKQQKNREKGFRQYMSKHFPHINIKELILPLDEDKKYYEQKMENFFCKNPDIHHGLSINSRAHIVGKYLLKTKRNNIQIMGYDMVQKNVDCLKNGTISFLIAQHAYQQGFSCVETLFRHIILKKTVQPVNYVSIELIAKENMNFYHRTRI